MTFSAPKLFAVYLGGRAPKCKTELHDVAFVVGNSIEETYDQLLDSWFGSAKGLHIDSWYEVRVLDGYRISVETCPFNAPEKLYFVNLGGYIPETFSEIHESLLVVSESEGAAKRAANAKLSKKLTSLHTDDLFDIDDCIELQKVNSLYIHISPTTEVKQTRIWNGYHPLPESAIQKWMRRS